MKIIKKLSGYIKLMRITVWAPFALSFATGFGIGATPATDLKDIVFGFLALMSCMSFNYALNFYADIDVDQHHNGKQKDMNLSKQPLVTGEVTKKECTSFCILTSSLTIAFSILVNSLFAFLLIAVTLIGVLYSHPWFRLKGKPPYDILCNIFAVVVLIMSAGYAITQPVMLPFLVILWASLIGVVYYILTIVTDYEFDYKIGIRTSAVAFGQRNLMKGMLVAYLLSLIVGYLIIIGAYLIDFKILIIPASIHTLVVVVVAWKNFKPPKIDISPQWILLPFTLLSIFFIYYGLSKPLLGVNTMLELLGLK